VKKRQKVRNMRKREVDRDVKINQRKERQLKT
jgi:hypothetical protein